MSDNPCEPGASDPLLEAVRALRVADPELGFKPLLAKLREQQPDLGAATKEVREALKALKAESEAANYNHVLRGNTYKAVNTSVTYRRRTESFYATGPRSPFR